MQGFFDKNYYEWENISKHKKLIKTAGKYIFIRDPNAKFYIEGINKNIKTIDDIIAFIKHETVSYELIIIGFSSGGSLAIILGNMLDNVKRVYCFGGIISLYTFTGAKNEYRYTDTEIFRKHEKDLVYSKWYSLSNALDNTRVPIYYFYGTKSVCDLIQIKEIEKTSNFYLIPIKSDRHGGDCYGFNYPYLFSMSNKKCNKLVCVSFHKELTKNQISIYTVGLFWCLIELLKKLIRKR